jgi:hypothetical protein
MKARKKVRIEKEKEYRPHAENLHAAKLFLKTSKEVRGGYYQVSASLIFCAFALEAYLNHLGQRSVDNWRDFSMAAPLVKLRYLAETSNLKLDPGERPMQTIVKLFWYRNCIAHGRSEPVQNTSEVSFENWELFFYEEALHKVEEFATAKNAERALFDVEKLIEDLNSKSKKPEKAVLLSGGTSGSSTILDG